METEYDYAMASLAGESETEAEQIQQKCFEESCAGLPDDRFRQIELGRLETSRLPDAPMDVIEQSRRISDVAVLAGALSSAADQIEGLTDAERKTLKEIQEALVHGDLPKLRALTQSKMNEAELARFAKLLEQTFAKAGVNARFFVDDHYRHYPIEDRQGPVLKMYWSPHEFSDDDGARLPIPTYVLAVGKDFTDVMVCLYGGEGVRPISGDIELLVKAIANALAEGATTRGSRTRRSPAVDESPEQLQRFERSTEKSKTERFVFKVADEGTLDTGESYRILKKDFGNGHLTWIKEMSSPLGDKLSITFKEQPKQPVNRPGTDRQSFIGQKWEYTTADGTKVSWDKSGLVIQHANGKEEAFPTEVLLSRSIKLGGDNLKSAILGGVQTYDGWMFSIRGRGFNIDFSVPTAEPDQELWKAATPTHPPSILIERRMQLIDGKLQPAESSNIQVRDSF